MGSGVRNVGITSSELLEEHSDGEVTGEAEAAAEDEEEEEEEKEEEEQEGLVDRRSFLRRLTAAGADQDVRQLVRDLTRAKSENLVAGEQPALIQSAELTSAVQRGLATTQDVRTLRIPTLSVAAGLVLPLHAYELTPSSNLLISVTEFVRLPYNPPPPEGSVAK